MRTPSISKKSKVYGLKSIVSSPHSAFRNPRSHGFTLLELLIVIALIMVLAGLMIPAFYKVRSGAKAKQRSIETRIIGSAIQAYKLQEKKFPAPLGDLRGGQDVTYVDDNNKVMSRLREAIPPVLDPNKLRWDNNTANANVIKPDGETPYTIKLDLDYDGKIDGKHVEYKVE